MNLGAQFADRRVRSALLAATAGGWMLSVIGAFADSGGVLGVGLVIVGVASMGTAKVLVELAVRERGRPVAASAVELAELVARIEGQAARADQQTAAVAARMETTAARLTAERVRAVADATSALRAEHGATAQKVVALEQRLAPSRRFRATKPTDDRLPRELALGESIAAAFFDPDAGR